VLVSSLEGKVTESARARKWTEIKVLPLDEVEKQELVKQKLASYGKNLTKENLVLSPALIIIFLFISG
jgi:hypothetical protein